MLRKNNIIINDESAVLNFYKYTKAIYSKKAQTMIITDASNKAFEFFIYWTYNNSKYSLNFKTSLYGEKLEQLRENIPIIIYDYIEDDIIYIESGVAQFIKSDDIEVVLTKYSNNEFKIELKYPNQNLELEKVFKI